MFKKLLVAYDGSPQARNAAQMAGLLAREQSPPADVYIVTVMDAAPRELGEPFLSEIIAQRADIGHNMISDAAAILGEGIPLHQELLFGSPAESIIEVAQSRSCDLIVMGTRGLGLLQGLLLGSQANKVISLAECPVLVVK